ncbi:hypothetical protein M2392_001815 [Pseudomonas grimontii]|nr:hypothetical protein [Pseudomonas grimontii]
MILGPILSAATSFLKSTSTSGDEREAQAIREKQTRDTLDNGWKSAEMSNIKGVINAGKGQ